MKKFIFLINLFYLCFIVDSFANVQNEKKIDIKNSLYFSNYLSGSILFNKFETQKSHIFFQNIKELGAFHSDFISKYIETLVINENIDEAYNYVKKLDKDLQYQYPNNLILFVYELKKKQTQNLRFHIINKSSDVFQLELFKNLEIWLNAMNKEKNVISEKKLLSESAFKNLSLSQNAILSLYLNNEESINKNFDLVLKNNELSRYSFFFLNYFFEKNDLKKIEEIISKNLEKNSESLLYKQLYVDFKNKDFSKIKTFYNRSDINHGVSELLYLFANFYQGYAQTQTSNFFLSLSNYLNPNFVSNRLLKIENMILVDNFDEAIVDLNKIEKLGSEFNWYVAFTRLKNQKDKKKIHIANLEKRLGSLNYFLEDKYFEYGIYLREDKNYKKSAEYLEKSLGIFNTKNKNKDREWFYLYHLGISQERGGDWKKAEKNFQKALQISPKQAEVINYLAYSWLEKNKNLEQAKEMLIEAVELSKGRGYILDSLGWAYYMLKDYKKAEELLFEAYEKEPTEAVIYDHYGDALWKNKKYLEARYVWQNAIKLKNIEDDLKENIKKKIIYGLDEVNNEKS